MRRLDHNVAEPTVQNAWVNSAPMKTRLVLTVVTHRKPLLSLSTDQLCDFPLSCLHDGATAAKAKRVELLWFLLGKFTYTTEFPFSLGVELLPNHCRHCNVALFGLHTSNRQTHSFTIKMFSISQMYVAIPGADQYTKEIAKMNLPQKRMIRLPFCSQTHGDME